MTDVGLSSLNTSVYILKDRSAATLLHGTLKHARAMTDSFGNCCAAANQKSAGWGVALRSPALDRYTQFSFCLYVILKPRNVLANKLVSYVQYVQLGNVKCTTRTEELRSRLPEASFVAPVVMQMGPKTKISKNRCDLQHDTKFFGQCGSLWNLRLPRSPRKIYSLNHVVYTTNWNMAKILSLLVQSVGLVYSYSYFVLVE